MKGHRTLPLRLLCWNADPASLAVFRIAVCSILLMTNEPSQAQTMAAENPALLVFPYGLATLSSYVPVTTTCARAMAIVYYVSCTTALIGWCTRRSLLLLVPAQLYLFGLTQLGGAVVHDMHLCWFVWILAASPCGDALSIDRFRRTEPHRSPSVYATPLVFARVLLAAIYFFPGYWKFKTSGWQWGFSDNLVNQMHWKWYESAWLPPLRADHYPSLCVLAAISVMAFELGAPVWFVFRPLTGIAAMFGITFHLCAQYLLQIPFLSLWATYVVLFEWRGLLSQRFPPPVSRLTTRSRPELVRVDPTKISIPRSDRLESPSVWPASPVWARQTGEQRSRSPRNRPGLTASPTDPSPSRRYLVMQLAVGFAVLVPVLWRGGQGMVQSFPFACYPTFQWMVGDLIPDLEVEGVDSKAQTISTATLLPASGKPWGLIWSALSSRAPNRDLLRAFANKWADMHPIAKDWQAIRLYRSFYSVSPQRWGQPPVSRELLGEFTR